MQRRKVLDRGLRMTGSSGGVSRRLGAAFLLCFGFAWPAQIVADPSRASDDDAQPGDAGAFNAE